MAKNDNHSPNSKQNETTTRKNVRVSAIYHPATNARIVRLSGSTMEPIEAPEVRRVAPSIKHHSGASIELVSTAESCEAADLKITR